MPAADEPANPKLAELGGIARERLAAKGVVVSMQEADALLRLFATIRPPVYDTKMYWMGMLSGGRGGGTSSKPGNIRLNMGKLVTAISAGVLTTVGVFQLPWTAVFGALVVWDSLRSAVRVDLSEDVASVMWALWVSKDHADSVPKAGLTSIVNAERAKYGRPPLSDPQLKDALATLQRLDAIEPKADDDARWWLREWVSEDYE